MAFSIRYVRADAAGSGDGTTNTNSGANGAFTIGEAITHSTTNTGIMYAIYEGGGTIANTTTNRTFSGAGTTTAPNWWRGFNTVLGDLDGNNQVLSKPLITFTTGVLTFSGAYQIVSGISFQANRNGPACTTTGAGVRLHRCRIENLNTGASANALSNTTNATTITECWLKTASSSASCVVATVTCPIYGCTLYGGGIGYNANTSAGTHSYNNIFNNCNIDGIRHGTTAGCVVTGNSFYNIGAHGVNLTTLSGTTGQLVIADNIFSGPSGYGIANITGTNSAIPVIRRNLYHNCGSGTTFGFGDLPIFDDVTDSLNPYTNPAASDFSLAAGGSGIQTGMPTRFEGETFTSYRDRGAVQQGLVTGLTIGQITNAITSAILLNTANRLDTDSLGHVGLQYGVGSGQIDFTNGIVKSNTAQVNGSSVVAASGLQEVNVTKINGALVNPSSAQLGVNVVNFGGSAGTFAGGRPEVNTSHIAGTSISTTVAHLGVNVVSYISGQAPLQPAVAGRQIEVAVDGHVNAKVMSYTVGEVPLKPTVEGRTLNVSASGNAGIDWANIENQSSTVNLSNTDINKTEFKLASDGLDFVSNVGPTGVASNFREMGIQLWRRYFALVVKNDSTGTIKTYADDESTEITSQDISSVGGIEVLGAA